MSDYAQSASFDTWCQRFDAGAQRHDLAALVGARLVTSIEASGHRRLDEAVISNATGGDKISACHKYRDPFDFTPRFKLWLVANARPRANDMPEETGLWRRLLCIPFLNKIPKDQIDPTVKAHFKDPAGGGPAVLRWAVEGAVAYAREGFRGTPASVTQATETYRTENDPISEFITSRCVLAPEDPDAFITKARLRELYEQWSKEEEGQTRLLKTTDISKRLRTPPYNCREAQRWMGNNKNLRVWYGIRERRTTDEIDATGSDRDVTAAQ